MGSEKGPKTIQSKTSLTMLNWAIFTNWKQTYFSSWLYLISIFKYYFQVSFSIFNFKFQFQVPIPSFNFMFQFQVSILSFNFKFWFQVSVSSLSFKFKFQFHVSVSRFRFIFQFHVSVSSFNLNHILVQIFVLIKVLRVCRGSSRCIFSVFLSTSLLSLVSSLSSGHLSKWLILTVTRLLSHKYNLLQDTKHYRGNLKNSLPFLPLIKCGKKLSWL